jgi:hypothetical protein
MERIPSKNNQGAVDWTAPFHLLSQLTLVDLKIADLRTNNAIGVIAIARDAIPKSLPDVPPKALRKSFDKLTLSECVPVPAGRNATVTPWPGW